MKTFTLTALAMLFVSTGAPAQVFERAATPAGSIPPISYLSRPPLPTEACVFTDENLKGARYCFGPQDKTPLPPEFTNNISSFIVPYGYEIFLYEDKFSVDYIPGTNRKMPSTDEHLLCRHLQTDPSLSYNGPAGLNGGCSDDPNADNRATSVKLEKLPSISDGQRRTAWANWPAVDDRFCAAKILTDESHAALDYAADFDRLGRSSCFGTYFKLDNFADYSSRNVSFDDRISGAVIRSRFVKLEFFENANQSGRSITLTCGNYNFVGVIRGITLDISSARISIMPQATTCTKEIKTIAAWN